MKSIQIKSEQSKTYAKSLIDEIVIEDGYLVEIKKVQRDSTARQRGLKWDWNKQVASSGLGKDDIPLDVHIRAKFKFGHAILMRDDEFYADLFTAFEEKYKYNDNYPKMLKWFSDKHIRTEHFTRKQQSEYMSLFQRYWIQKGVNLTDPLNRDIDLTSF